MNKTASKITPFLGNAPQPIIREIPEGEEFPVEALGPLKEVVLGVHDKTQAPIAIAAQSALSIASLATQAFGNVETEGRIFPCSLFVLTIAQSGERKSSCDKLLIEQIRVYEQDAQKIYNAEVERHAIDLRIWEKKREKLLMDAMDGKTADKQAAANAELEAFHPQPHPPRAPNRTVTEPTFEGLVKLYEKSHPSLGLLTDEGGGLIGGHAMNKDNVLKTCAGLSSLWDGAPIVRTRAGDGSLTMYGRRLAIHIMVQPVAARPMLANPVVASQGFLARFLICEPPSTIGTRTRRGYDPVSDAQIATFGAKLRLLLETEPPLRKDSNNELDPPALTLSDEATDRLWYYFKATEEGQKAGGEYSSICPFASKSAEQAVRIAAVLTLWENVHASEITAHTMGNAIILARYYLIEAKRLVDSALVSEKASRAEMLRLWLLNKWADKEILPSDVVKHGPNSLRDTKKVKEALAVVEEHGWIVRIPPETVVRGAHRTTAYRIVRVAESG
ncbi:MULTISPECIES: YfjI family protein [unclassified Falsihalocynthiibacter]|uniref:YfjI family protein n=1 Tax=unclassified Falsihalocynthiibacter TaxID=2854191 RepID=UPI00350F90C8